MCLRPWTARCRLAFFESALHGGSFLVVVPGRNQQEGKWSVWMEILLTQLHGVAKRCTASLRHITAQAPGCMPVIESGPGAADGNLVFIFRLHGLIEVTEIIFSPVAAIRLPTLLPRVDPGKESVKDLVWNAGCVFVNQERRWIPFVGLGAHAIPIGMSAFGEDANHRAAVVCAVGFA